MKKQCWQLDVSKALATVSTNHKNEISYIAKGTASLCYKNQTKIHIWFTLQWTEEKPNQHKKKQNKTIKKHTTYLYHIEKNIQTSQVKLNIKNTLRMWSHFTLTILIIEAVKIATKMSWPNTILHKQHFHNTFQLINLIKN